MTEITKAFHLSPHKDKGNQLPSGICTYCLDQVTTCHPPFKVLILCSLTPLGGPEGHSR